MTTLHDVMREGFLFVVQRTDPVSQAIRVMVGSNVGIVAVLDGDRLVGVFSERDVVRRVVAKGLEVSNTRVGDVMTRDLVICDETEECRAAMRMMDQANIRHLPVVRGSQVVSMLSIRDLMRVDMVCTGEERRLLQEYPYTAPPVAALSERK